MVRFLFVVLPMCQTTDVLSIAPRSDSELPQETTGVFFSRYLLAYLPANQHRPRPDLDGRLQRKPRFTILWHNE
ncbi:hypothetical protein EDB19DRAFT_1701906 [Suillus lakei]|nr:hypothetical protein EDB19DRAFT_1701906 [Suillus lakei]